MSHLFEYVNLPGDSLYVWDIYNFVFFQYFDSHLFPSQRMNAQLNFAKSAFS